jgi:hypothetical protein
MSNKFYKRTAIIINPILVATLVLGSFFYYKPNTANADDERNALENFVSDSNDVATEVTISVGLVFLECLASLALTNMVQALTTAIGLSIAETATSVTTLEVPVKDIMLRTKSAGGFHFLSPSLDAIAYCLINKIISSMLIDITNWIKTGGRHGPLFIQNPKEFFSQLADESFGETLNTLVSGVDLCQPFQVGIRLALEHNWAQRKRPDACKLSDIVDNMDNFVSGNFNEGGWRGWFSLSQRESPYGKKDELDKIIAAKISGENNRAQLDITWGSGFPSFKDRDGAVTSPGALINLKIANVTGIPYQRLALADEFNELLTALLDMVVTEIFNSAFGTGSDIVI